MQMSFLAKETASERVWAEYAKGCKYKQGSIFCVKLLISLPE